MADLEDLDRRVLRLEQRLWNGLSETILRTAQRLESLESGVEKLDACAARTAALAEVNERRVTDVERTIEATRRDVREVQETGEKITRIMVRFGLALVGLLGISGFPDARALLLELLERLQ